MGNFHSFVDQCLLKDGLSMPIVEKSIVLQTFECGFCGEVKNSSVDLKSHLSYVHFSKELEREFPAKKSEKTCDLCGKLFSSKQARIRHIGYFHDQVLKYAKKFINVIDAQQIAENGFVEGGELFDEEDSDQYLADWGHPSSSVSTMSSPQISVKNIAKDDTVSVSVSQSTAKELFPSEQPLTIMYSPQISDKNIAKDDTVSVSVSQSIAKELFPSEQPLTIMSSPQISDKNIAKDDTVSVRVSQSIAKELFPSEQPQPLLQCPLTQCFRRCTNKAEILVHLAMTHYLDELQKEYGADFNMSHCKLCDKSLPTSKEGFLKHMAVDHEAVMTYVERDMALEAELNRAVDDLEVTN